MAVEMAGGQTGWRENLDQFTYLGRTSKSTQPLSAGASVDRGVEAEIRERHVNRAADRGCHDAACSPLVYCEGSVLSWEFSEAR